jgi:hypothetical protein
LKSHYRRVSSSTDGVKALIAIPFHHLIPALRDIPAIYLGLGQRLVMNLRLVPAGECLMADANDAAAGEPTYTVGNAHGIFTYSILDAPRRDMILRNNISPIPIVKNVSFQQIAAETLAL